VSRVAPVSAELVVRQERAEDHEAVREVHARAFGDGDMIRFVQLVLLRDESYDAAARDAFHQPFATVDQACAAWIRRKA
jgi:hypothetical protein